MLVDAFELALQQDPSSAVRDLARDEVQRARELLIAAPRGVEHAIHEFRKSMKGLRALARLVRSSLGREFRRCNLGLRNAGRLLSALRDEEAVLEALRALRSEFLDDAEHAALDRTERRLLHHRHGRYARDQLVERIGPALLELERAGAILNSVKLSSYGDVERGLSKTYRSAYRRFRELRGERDDVTLHELRKRIKDVRVHLDLLRQSAPADLRAESRIADEASELLGRDHDLVALTSHLDQLDLVPGDRIVLERLIASQRTRLQVEAMDLCAHLLREKPAQRTARLLGYLARPIASRSHAWT